MMTQPSLSALAKQGNPDAIASLITRSLSPQGITAKASLKGDCLRVMLESLQVPDQQAAVQFIRKGLTKLKAESIKTVKIYGRQVGTDFPAWSQELDLASQPPPVSHNPPQDRPTQTQYSSDSDSLLVAPSNFQATEDSIKVSHNDSKAKATDVPKRISQVLVGFLGLQIGFDSLFVIYTVVWATSYYIYNLLGVADATGFLVYLIRYLVIAIDSLWNPLEITSIWIYRVTVVITLVWLHRLHASLRTTFSEYPIQPWGAVARFIIPFYSLWGIWNIFATLANRLDSQQGDLVHFGTSLRRWLLWFYLSMISSNLLNQIYLFQYRRALVENFSPWFFVAKNGAALLFAIVWLQIVRLSNKAIIQTRKRNSIQLNPEDQAVEKLPIDRAKNNSIKAITYGLLVDIIGTLLANWLISLMIRLIAAVNETVPEPIAVIFSSYPSGLVVRLTIGLIFTLLGGFIAAHFAKKIPLKHSFVMGTLSVFISLTFVMFQVEDRYRAIALLLGIPAALLGGYLRQITRKS
jgi:hypothetical protein